MMFTLNTPPSVDELVRERLVLDADADQLRVERHLRRPSSCVMPLRRSPLSVLAEHVETRSASSTAPDAAAGRTPRDPDRRERTDGSVHSKDLRAFEITDKGILMGETLSGYEGLLTGSPELIPSPPPEPHDHKPRRRRG